MSKTTKKCRRITIIRTNDTNSKNSKLLIRKTLEKSLSTVTKYLKRSITQTSVYLF